MTMTPDAPMTRAEYTLRAAIGDIRPALDLLIDFLKSDDCPPERMHDAAGLLRHAADRIDTLGGPVSALVLPPGVVDLGRRRRLRRIGAGVVR